MFTIEIDFIILAVLIALSAFFASAETAFISMNRIKIKRLADMNVPGAKLLQELKMRQQKILITILICNDLLQFMAASIAAAISLDVFRGNLGIAISTAAVTFVVVIFADITPKSLALRHAPFIALKSAPLLYFLSWILSPVISVLEWISGFFTRLFGVQLDEQKLTEEEVKVAASMSAEEGSILAEEKEMIHRIFTLNDITVKEVMTPAPHVAAFKAGTLVKDIAPAVLDDHERYPVYGRSLNDILGIFYVRDYLGKALGSAGNIHVEKVMRKPFFVSGSRKLDSLLKEFRSRRLQMAIVIDSKGDTIGVVTIEDVLGEIVGDIREN